jgi:pyruvate,water dikinase
MAMYVKRFQEIGKDMFQECGGKAAHLGELTNLKLSVPNGFVVLGEAFFHHLKSNHLEEQIRSTAAPINYDDFKDLEEKTAEIRALIIDAVMPPDIEKEIIENYASLSGGEQEPFMAVRSSVAVKDSPISSFPGMMDTFHYIRGGKNVVEKVKECWASVWSGRAAFARHSKGIDHMKAIIAPTAQLMVNSEVAGVLFTVNPISGAKDEIVIEANWGLGETVVCGKCQSDLYIVSKKPFKIRNKKIARKEQTFIQAKEGSAKWVPVEPDKVDQPTLTDEQIEELCKVACTIEDHYGCHQDIEWAYEKGNLYILQTRTAKAGGD